MKAVLLMLAGLLAAPGTPARPVLSAAEAAPYTAANYLGFSGTYAHPVADPWRPTPIRTPRRPDLVVGGRAGLPDVQQAVNAAYRAGGTRRLAIAVRPGTYPGTVFIPAGTPPLTLYGDGPADRVRLQFTVDATSTPAQWAAQVNATGRYAEGDPAWPMFQSCATRTTATVGLCATVVWAQSTDLQLRGLTITNTLLDTVDRGTHQALALRTDADRTQLQDMRLIGRQDTFLANANDVTSIARVSVRRSYVEGDTDFVFGRAAAVFDHCTFRLVSTRKPAGGVIFAPNTDPHFRYGFLVTRSRLLTDAAYRAAPTGHLGRAWDQGAGATGYLPGVTPNGQLVIRDSHLGAGFDTAAPWAPAATTSRPFQARVDVGRDLDDVAANRLWEYRNHGPGAQ
ncbi:putative pectinesterase [Actinoplanes sp. SE50]|uniref:putative acyl-CoA thioester hydrolase n=1 Tax=unclassified Actinoplanes TaxID=2626549 RepID=UPI00023EC0BD|nr:MULTISPECIES: putative acyl-CoA thioester hydrolase [unclassified Actinoplanes]AEV84054.1 putative pectinesterase [Actinoplanes sp. SE50/110]ATO82446.1 putative pectinesterase [Actinoplanes sp. SE50]SLL99853.1 pectinesterase [Actinoplanes sp. SE50/110]